MLEALSIAPPPAAWAETVARLRARTPGSFDAWFGGVQLEDFTDGVLSLRARDAWVQSWVTLHFLPELVATLAEVSGLHVVARWTVGPIERPVAEGGTNGAAPRAEGARASALSPAMPPAIAAGSEVVAAAAALEGGAAPAHELAGPPVPGPAASVVASVLAPDADPIFRQTFGDFVVGPSNQLAHAASLAVAGDVGTRHNPLFLCGGTGLGKTHLLGAIGGRVRELRPRARVVYVSAEAFMNQFIEALQTQSMAAFRARYRDHVDVLLMDDVQFLAGKTQTQEEFFHVFNALHQAGKQIVLTSDKYPQQLDRMEERLVSRFHWGLVADMQAPELETRVAIVRRKARHENLFITDDVAIAIARGVRSNVRELEGLLVRLAAKASLLHRSVDVDFVRQELALCGSARPTEAGIDDVQRVVGHHFRVTHTELVGKERHRRIALARHVAMYLCKQLLRCSYPEIGRAFGGRDHTTVMSGVRRIEELREGDAEVRAHLEALRRKLGDE
jgi:chromosomal replication initiator protein